MKMNNITKFAKNSIIILTIVIQCITINMKGVDIMTISVRLNNKDTELIKTYAKMNNISISDLIRDAVIEKIEDEYDLKCYKEAVKEYEKNPKTYTLKEVKKELGL